MPGMKAAGKNTELSTSVMAITGPVISSTALTVASLGERPIAIHRSTFSTTTIASSTTIPMANTSPSSETLLSENPNAAITAKVPIKDTGTSIIGISVARQSWRKTSTTMNTRTKASNRVLYTSWTDSLTNLVVP